MVRGFDPLGVSLREVAGWVRDARQRTFDMIRDLHGEALVVPRVEIVNPFIWEIGHVAWFMEKWALRHALSEEGHRADADAIFDSAEAIHETRWEVPLPNRDETGEYLTTVHDRVLDRLLAGRFEGEKLYYPILGVLHEDMHGEAILYTRQTLAYPEPELAGTESRRDDAFAGAHPGDVEIPGGTWRLGTTSDVPFAFDNELDVHYVEVEPFAIARAPVTQAEYLEFVEDGGYRKMEHWTEEGRRWLREEGATGPVYWRPGDGGWEVRVFDQWEPISPNRPVVHVNWFEAKAFCNWAGRRLPSEAEWEVAAAGEPGENGLSSVKRRYPWGDDPPNRDLTNLDGRYLGLVDVVAHRQGDSAFGCRQMLGNVWEWTESTFRPYPEFTPGPYREFSEPWFGDHLVLRGGCWATRNRLIHNAWRNFYRPHRRDIWAGFRTARE